jgi:CAAX prenyl protease-like protein
MTEPAPSSRDRDDLAYILPMAVFLAFTFVGGQWPATYPATYVLKTLIVAGMLIAYRKAYTPIKWDYWWLGVIVGVIGVFQWVLMQLWLQEHFAMFRPDPAKPPFDPTQAFSSETLSYAFIGFRWIAGAVLLVPVMEELFWRDFLWRQILAPANFKLAEVGEKSWVALLVVSGAFATVHGNWWPTAIVWGLMVGVLLILTRSLGACIVAHAITNLLLGSYVLVTRDWGFW